MTLETQLGIICFGLICLCAITIVFAYTYFQKAEKYEKIIKRFYGE